MIRLIESKANETRGKYNVVSMTGSGELGKSISTNNPKVAIENWFKLQKSSPTCVTIDAYTKEDALALLKTATPELIEDMYSKYHCPYKKDWMIKEVQENINRDLRFFSPIKSNSYEEGEEPDIFPDSIHPFGMG